MSLATVLGHKSGSFGQDFESLGRFPSENDFGDN
jgi:hypothetical protein